MCLRGTETPRRRRDCIFLAQRRRDARATVCHRERASDPRDRGGVERHYRCVRARATIDDDRRRRTDVTARRARAY